MNWLVESNIKNKIIKSITKYKKNGNISIALINNDKEIIYGNNCYYDIGSISKVFTSLLVLDLVSKGKIKLDDTIDKYIDLPSGVYPTIFSLLSHRTGYHHLTPISITFWPLFFHHYKNKNIYENITKKEVIKEIIKRKNKISNKYCYSDFTYAILAVLLESIYNSDFNKIMDEYLKSIGLYDSLCINSNIERISKKNWRWNSDNPYLASGGIASTISDMIKFIRYEFDRVHEDEFKIMKKHNLTYFTTPKGHLFWHVGGVGYFRSSILINPKRRIGVIVMGNNIGLKGANPYYISKLLYTAIRRNKIIFD